uniref:Prominin 1a n=1 Tax=Astyanax mexicanus TaxID=7994 RepID=A0A8B9HIL0_ASTMX
MLWRAALALGLVLLLLPHTEPRAPLDFGLVPGGVYDTVAHYEPGPIGLLFNMVHAFLHVVQPNPFPEDLVIRVAKDKFGAIKSEYQKVRGCQKSWYPYGRRLGISNVYCCLFSHLVHRAGVLCAYAANQHLSSQLKNMRRLVNSNLRDLHTFANDTPAQIDYLISQYGTAKEQVLCDLDNVGVLLGGKIHDELGKEVRPALDGVLNMAGVKVEKAMKVMRDTKEALENVSVTLETLQEGTGKLQFNLSVVRAGLSNALSDPACADALSVTGDICQNIRSSLAQLEISANYSRLPGVTNQLNKVNDVLRTDLSLSVQKGLVAFNDTPTMVTEQTRNVAEGVRNLLDGIGKNISSFSKQFPIQSSLNNFTVMISHTHSRIEDYYPEIDQIDFYRWICCIALCCMVVLILAFNFLGLLCGILGFDRHASPTTRGCVSNTGGNLLMAGVGFSFLFSWLLMGVVTATFLVGGNVEKLVCEPFSSRQLFKVLDTPHLVNPTWRNFIPGYLYNDPDMDLTVENLYSNCKENRGIYSALHLDKVFNVSALLNTSVYTKEVSQKFEGVRVDLRSIILLDAEGKQNLISFTETGIGEINFAAYLEELNKGVTRVDLLSYANNLDAQADQLSRGSLQTSLKGHANTLRQIHSHQVLSLQQSMVISLFNTLNQSIRFLERTASDLSNKVSEVVAAVDAAQFLISQNATFVVNQETEKYKQTIIGYFRQYLDWIKTSVSTVLVLLQNTFWFGLGCSTLFLLPSIILSVRLAKFYRRMDTEDVYDDMEIGNNGYYNEHLQGIQNPVITSIPTYDTMTRFPRASAPPRQADW